VRREKKVIIKNKPLRGPPNLEVREENSGVIEKFSGGVKNLKNAFNKVHDKRRTKKNTEKLLETLLT